MAHKGARTIVQEHRAEPVPWWLWAGLALALFAATPPSHAQSTAPTLPPGSGGDGKSTPSAPPPDAITPGTADGGPASAHLIPDPGVTANPPIIRPPMTGPMPVIPPPGSPGGDPRIIPKP